MRIINFLIFFQFLLAQFAADQEITKRDDQRFRLARQYEVAGRYEDALRIYQELWDKNLQNINYYRGVRDNLIHLKRYTEAILISEKMLTVQSTYTVKADLGDVYYKSGKSDKALQIWNDIIEQNEKTPGAYQAVANSMISNRLYNEAIALYKEGIKKISKSTTFLIDLANIYSLKLDYMNATLMYLEYLKHMPNQFSFVESQLTRLAKNIEDIDAIITIVKKEVKVSPNHVLLQKLLADLYIQSSNYGKALESYRIIDDFSKTLSPREQKDWEKELFTFAKNALKDGEYSFSEQAFSMFIAKNSDSYLIPQAQLGLAAAIVGQKDYSRAIEKLEEIISLFPNHKEAEKAYLNIGDIKLNYFSETNSAKDAFMAVISKFPISNEHFEAMFNIAECEIRLGNINEAKNWYQRIYDSKRAEEEYSEKAVYHLALINFWNGDFDSAMEKLEKLTQDFPTIVNRQTSGFYVNDALEYSMLIEENRENTALLKDYALCSLQNYQHDDD